MKLISFFTLSLLLSVLSCQKSGRDEMPKRYRTMEDVRVIATTYGLDSLATEEKNGALQFWPESDVHEHFKKEKIALESRHQFHSFMERTIWVNSFEDYIALIDSLPIMRQEEIDSKGGPEKYQQWIDTMKKTKWHIYRLKEGGIGFEYPDRDSSIQHPGKTRMDNK